LQTEFTLAARTLLARLYPDLPPAALSREPRSG